MGEYSKKYPKSPISLDYLTDLLYNRIYHFERRNTMPYIVAFANQKGGVGKTTSTVNIAASLAVLGKRVLLCDLDPQGNATSAVGINKRELTTSTYDVLVGNSSASRTIRKTQWENLWLMPSTISLAGAEFDLIEMEHREGALKKALKEVENDFDIIVIDCPPSLGLLTVNALTASNGVLIPMQCEYFALEGLTQLMYTIRKVKQLYNPTLVITGILITMYNGRLNLSVQVMDELKKYYADKLFDTVITRNVRLSEAPSYGKPAYYYDRNSKGTQSYLDVSKELLQRI